MVRLQLSIALVAFVFHTNATTRGGSRKHRHASRTIYSSSTTTPPAPPKTTTAPPTTTLPATPASVNTSVDPFTVYIQTEYVHSSPIDTCDYPEPYAYSTPYHVVPHPYNTYYSYNAPYAYAQPSQYAAPHAYAQPNPYHPSQAYAQPNPYAPSQPYAQPSPYAPPQAYSAPYGYQAPYAYPVAPYSYSAYYSTTTPSPSPSPSTTSTSTSSTLSSSTFTPTVTTTVYTTSVSYMSYTMYTSTPTIPYPYVPPPSSSYSYAQPPPSYAYAQPPPPPPAVYTPQPSTITYEPRPSAIAYVLPPSKIAYEPTLYYKPTPEYITYAEKAYPTAIPVEPYKPEPNSYMATVIPAEPYKPEPNPYAPNPYSASYTVDPYKQEQNIYATNTYAAQIPVEPYRPEYVPHAPAYVHPPPVYYSPAPSKPHYSAPAALIYIGDRSHVRQSAGVSAESDDDNVYAVGQYYAKDKYPSPTRYTHIPPTYSGASSFAITIALPEMPYPTATYYPSPATPYSKPCSTFQAATKRPVPTVPIEPMSKKPPAPEYQRPPPPPPPPPPKCTWSGRQINDPVTWDPVPTYAYNDMPKTAPGPGSIDPDVWRVVTQLTLKEKIGQMTQIEVGQIIDCNGELNRTAVEYWID
ncbi:hypothetical protein GGF44_003867, partial [Coemansia sp. RSA 1694]